MTHVNSIQYGGDHYRKAGHKQHWDSVADLGGGWEYYVARATAYLTRVKDQQLDPKKGVHFIDKLVSLINERRVPHTYVVTQQPIMPVETYLAEYFEANSIPSQSDTAAAITLLVKARTKEDLLEARTIVARIAGVE